MNDRNVGVTFVDKKSDERFEALKDGAYEERQLYAYVIRAIQDLKKDVTCGTRIPKEYWPRYYDKHNITNLWKYDLPNAWRLIYTIKSDEVLILAVILEWFDHKGYEKRFGYENKCGQRKQRPPHLTLGLGKRWATRADAIHTGTATGQAKNVKGQIGRLIKACKSEGKKKL